ncbi:hypothetical protein V6N13_108909 [Hibiscus sabdariffa]
MFVSGKTSRATIIKKPLTVNFVDFPVLSRFSHKAFTSRSSPPDTHSSILDKSKPLVTVMKENDNPNIVDGSSRPIGLNAESFSPSPKGDPSDMSTRLNIDAQGL